MMVMHHGSVLARAARSAAAAVVKFRSSAGRARPAGAAYLPEPLEARRLLTGYWVTLGEVGPDPYTDPPQYAMRIHPDYDPDGDGVANEPVDAPDAAAAIKKAMVGHFNHRWSRCDGAGTQTFAKRYEFPTDDAFGVAVTQDPASTVYWGAIEIRGNTDVPYPMPSAERDAVHHSWSVSADPRPHVWVEATDAEAKEDNRDPAAFAIKSRGGNPSQPVTVRFQFGGEYGSTATASPQPESAFPDGIAWEDEADYTVQGATPDPADPGWWTVQLSGGQATVTVKPLNDAAYEGDETIHLDLYDDADGPTGGSYLLAATQPATTNPASMPATARATTKPIAAAVVPTDTDANKPLEGTVRAKVAELNHAQWQTRDAARNQLSTWLGSYSSLESLYKQLQNENAGTPEITNSLDTVLSDRLPVGATIDSSGQIALMLRQAASNAPGVTTEVTVRSDNPQVAAVRFVQEGATATVTPGSKTVPNLVIVPRSKGTEPATISVILHQRGPDGEIIPTSVSRRKFTVTVS